MNFHWRHRSHLEGCRRNQLFCTARNNLQLPMQLSVLGHLMGKVTDVAVARIESASSNQLFQFDPSHCCMKYVDAVVGWLNS